MERSAAGINSESLRYQREVNHVSVVGIGGNLCLSVFKFIAGLVGHSGAMLSDALHSASDIAGSLVVMIGVSLSERQADREHPYGHERMECIASILLALLLLGAGLVMGLRAGKTILDGSYSAAEIPGRIALIAAVVSIAVKEGMFWYTRRRADRIGSGALRAEAWHHRSDALSSVGALIGIGGARLGFRILDPAAGIVICLFILKAAVDIFREAVEKMTDHSGGEELERQIRDCVGAFQAIMGVDLLRTREFGRKVYVDLEIRMDGTLSLEETHRVAEQLHDRLEEELPQIKHVMIHVNPG